MGQEEITTEKLLEELEKLEYPFPQFKLCKESNQMKIIGHGGFSFVYEVRDKEHPQNHYALKVTGLEKHVVSSERFWNTFRMQRILCDYSPFIVRTLSARELLVKYEEEEGIIVELDSNKERWTEEGIILQFVLMEKLEDIIYKDKFGNASLLQKILQDEEEVLKFAFQIGQAILTAHENHVLHRDIKLENIFWDAKEECYKLGDFGISKYTEGGNAETLVYTQGYGAPEIECRLGEVYNATADIYSFGITLYLLLNELKFPGSEGYYANAIQYTPEFVFPAPVHASTAMTRVIRKMCCFEKDDRYQSMAEVLEALKHISEENESASDVEIVELANLTTETYREEKNKEEKKEEVFDVNRILEKYEEEKKTRAGRKRIQKEKADYYNATARKYFIWFTLLFALLFKGLQKDTIFIPDWQFWILPVLVFVDGIFLELKEWYVLFGIFVIGVAVYSISVLGLTVPHIILLLCVLSRYSNLTLAGAAGTGLWMFLEFSGRLSWLDFIPRYHLGWIIILLILWQFEGYRELRMEYKG